MQSFNSKTDLLIPPSVNDEDKPHRADISNGMAVMTLLKALCGSGALFLARSFIDAGIVAGSATLLLSTFITMYCCLLMVESKHHVLQSSLIDVPDGTKMNYSELAFRALGVKGREFVNVGTILIHMGATAIYIGFIVSNLRLFILYLSPTMTIDLNIFYAGLFIPVLLLALVRNIDLVAQIASFGNYLVMASMAYIFATGLWKISRGEVVHDYSCPALPQSGVCIWIDTNNFATFFGTAAYCFYSVTFVLPIEESMKDRKALPKLIVETFTIVSVVALAICILCALVWGESLRPILFQNSPNELTVQILMVSFSVVLLSTVPPLIYTPVQICETWFGLRKTSWEGYHILNRAILITGSFVCAWLAGEHRLSNMVSLFGALFCGPLSFILPGFLHLKLVTDSSFRARCLDYFIIIFGTVASIVSCYTTIVEWK